MTRMIVMVINPGLQITPQVLPPAAENQPYSVTLRVLFGELPIKTRIVSGVLPDGLTLVDNGDGTATISGTPTETGDFAIEVEYEDVREDPRMQPYVVRVAVIPQPAVPIVVSGTAPDGEVGVPYTYTFTATGGNGGPYTWTLASGSLPAGLSLSTGGSITGTPTTEASYSFVVRASDGENPPGDSALQSVDVEGASDPYWANVSSLIYPSAITGGNVVDETGLLWPISGGASVDSSHLVFGAPSLLVTANLLLELSGDDDDFDFGGADFAIEFVANLNSTGTQTFFSKRTDTSTFAGVVIVLSAGQMIMLAHLGGGWDVFITDPDPFPLNVDVAVCARRVGNSWQLWVNNVMKASTTNSGSVPNNSAPPRIGENRIVAGAWLAQYRITKGNARTPSIPQTAPWPNS